MTSKEDKKSKKKKKARAKKKCLHNILVRQKYGDPWRCGRCGKKMSDAEMKRRMPRE